MDRLSDFKPLERVTLPGIEELRCSGLTILVGPNSSGKTQFLRDLSLRLSGEARQLVVATEVCLSKPEFEPLMRCLKAEGYFEARYDNNGREQLRPLTTYLGTGESVAADLNLEQARAWHREYMERSEPTAARPDDFLRRFGKLLVTGLFLDRRLMSLNAVGVIDFLLNPVANDLQALFLNDSAQEQLWDEVLTSFAKGVWLDNSRGNILSFRVGDQDCLPTAKDRLSATKMAGYRTIETEGDGLRSYVATVVALLLQRRPVCLIDEPEMCLHPPQAYNLGRFIGRVGSSLDTATFVATHSSEILRGAIETGSDIQIVRHARRDGQFLAHLLPAEDLKLAVTKPTVRAESVLDGIFAQSVVVVEADGDRLVYQAVLQTLVDELQQDLHFATAGGTGGVADICKLYRALNVPIAVIADLDMLADPGHLRQVLDAITAPANGAALEKEARSVMKGIAVLPPLVTQVEIKEDIRRIQDAPFDWTNEGDIKMSQALSQVSQKLNRMRRLKRGRIAALPEDISLAIGNLLDALKEAGVFLVPVGELEDWLENEEIPESKQHKWAWANAAALRIQSKGSCDDDLWNFVRGVGMYLSTH